VNLAALRDQRKATPAMLERLLTELDSAPASSLRVTQMVWDVERALGSDRVQPPLHSFHAKPDRAERVREGYARHRREWAMRRGLTWTPSDKRSLHTLMDFATLAHSCAPLMCESPTPGKYRVLYDDGTLVSLETKDDIDVKTVAIDRTLAIKVQDKGLGPVCDACIVGDGLVLSFCERSMLGFVSSRLLSDATVDR